MSSKHYTIMKFIETESIREIMKGIIFTGGLGPKPKKCRKLAEGCSLIAAADSGLMLAEAAGIVPSIIIGDMDSLDDPRRLEKYPPETVCRFSHDKDFTDTELALDYLFEKGCDEILIAGGGGGRTDHLLAIYSLFEREKFPVRWVTDKEDIYCLTPGKEFSSSVSVSSIISVFPLGIGPWEAESSGLKWPLNDLDWKRGFFGLCNRIDQKDQNSAGSFSIHSIKGRFLIIMTSGEDNGGNN